MIPGRQLIGDFDPRTIPGLHIWLDAADSNTLTFSGTNVSQWVDKSSNAYTFSNAVSRGPTRTQTLNGRDVLTFTATGATDANGQFLTNTRTVPYNLVRHSIFLVHRPTTVQSNYGDNNLLVLGTGGANSIRVPASLLNISYYFNDFRSSESSDFFRFNDVSSSYNLGSVVVGHEGIFVVRNGVRTTTPLWGGLSPSNFLFTSSNFIGAIATATPSNFYSGNVAEILYYSNTLTNDERLQVEGYLAWKWGLQGNLPTTQSYSSNPPLSRPLVPLDIPDCIVWFDAADTATITASGTTVTQWRNKGLLSDICGSAPVGTVSTGFTFNTSPLNTVRFPGGAHLIVSNVVTSTPARTQFFIFTVTSFGDGYSRIFASTTFTGNRQAGFNAWNRDGNTVNMFPGAYSATELISCTGQTPFVGTLPYTGTPFVMGVRHTASSGSNDANLGNRISINGRAVSLAGNQKLSFGYFVGTDTFLLGTGPGYANVQQIGEVIQYDRALTNQEMIEVEGYLCRKWNVSLSDASHAFIRLPPATPSIFFPSGLEGCRLWLDAADTGTITATGSSATSWRDKSGFGFTVTFTASPTTGTTQQNGNNVLVFSSSYGSNLDCVINAANHTLIAVHRPSADSSNTSLFRFQTGTGSPYVIFPYTSGGTQRGWVTSEDGAGLTITGTGLPDGSPTSSYSLLIASISNGTQEVFRNGVRVASNTQALTTTTTPGLTIGATTTGTEVYGGNVAELIVYNARLTAAQRQLVEGYLAKKWGL